MKLSNIALALGTVLVSGAGIYSQPAIAGCNPFGCSSSSAAECNPFGCPNAPMGAECSPFGCPPSPQANNQEEVRRSGSREIRALCRELREDLLINADDLTPRERRSKLARYQEFCEE